MASPSDPERPASGAPAGPDPAGALLSRAQQLLRARRTAEAVADARRAVSLAPGRADAWMLLGAAAIEDGRLGEAEGALARAAALAPDRPWVHAQRARALVALGRWREAAAAAEAAEALSPADPLVRDTLGCAWSHINLPDRAIAHFEAATAARPDRADFWFNLAGGLRFMGRLDEAESAYERALSLSPSLATAHQALARLRKWTPARNHVERLEVLLARTPPDGIDAVRLRYALFKELDDLGRRGEAWRHLSDGAALARRKGDWTLEGERALVAALKASFPREHFAAAGGVPERAGGTRPIFVLGLPRSGTTLVERVLARHSRVRAMGELQTFPLLVKRAAGTPGQRLLDAATATAAAGLDFADLGRRYLEETAYLARGAAHATDKLPQNHYLAGALRLAFPGAAIVHVRRSPMDTLFGAFKLLFGRAYDYSYALEDLAGHYLGYRSLMAHWKECLGDGLVEIRYEDLTADPEPRIRALLDACGLPFEEACLSPHEDTGAVLTASATQVRRPIHREAVEAWRAYATELEPLRRRLEEAGVVDAEGREIGQG